MDGGPKVNTATSSTIKRTRKGVANEVARERQVEPDARTKFAVLKARREMMEAVGQTFENRITPEGEWV